MASSTSNDVNLSLSSSIDYLSSLRRRLRGVSIPLEKVEILLQDSRISQFLEREGPIPTFLAGLTPECAYIIYALIAIEQGDLVLHIPEDVDSPYEQLRQLIQRLLEVEKFYEPIGGIIGYHLKFLDLLLRKRSAEKSESAFSCSYLQPPLVDLREEGRALNEAILAGIEQLPSMAEIYPIGGAGDRLGLTDPESGAPLPVARLQFGGITLLEGMIRDLEAREALYYKLFGQQVLTPIALMTSDEKENDTLIRALLEEKRWFGRPKESFCFAKQPLVPALTDQGRWAMKGPLHPLLKPGGHGMIWKLFKDQGVFDKLRAFGRTKALVRQINNPTASSDHTLLSFAGVGLHGKHRFGFASCPRIVGAAEGTDVMIERTLEHGEGYEYVITNIEYSDMQEAGVEDRPVEPGSPYSEFPANSNILFVDLAELERAVATDPYPGLLINLKSTTSVWEGARGVQQRHIGRIESTMQNIADNFSATHPSKVVEGVDPETGTYVTYNHRNKTLGVTKQLWKQGGPLLATPEDAFYTRQCNLHHCLTELCDFSLPPQPSLEEVIQGAPLTLVNLHPALGPLHQVIAQKLRGGALHQGSELTLDLAEVALQQVEIDGCACVRALAVSKEMSAEQDEAQYYGERIGRCHLKNVSIHNRGIAWERPSTLWKDEVVRNERFEVVLCGFSEFVAENVCFSGDFYVEIPDGMRGVAVENQNGGIEVKMEPLSAPSWRWEYRVAEDRSIQLSWKAGRC